ncbi:hypothetical protein [Aphanothece sacrum]|nr:hypothetical protein [Aphanothece sacrum]
MINLIICEEITEIITYQEFISKLAIALKGLSVDIVIIVIVNANKNMV